MIFEGVDRALRLELQRSWEASDRGRMLYEVLPRVGREWQPLDIDRVPRRGVTLVSRFLIGHCHLGDFLKVPAVNFQGCKKKTLPIHLGKLYQIIIFHQTRFQ